MSSLFLRIIACEVALREICQVIPRSPNIVDLEFVPQGLHDQPARGREEMQGRLATVPAGKYDAVLVGYGLCGNLIAGLEAAHTPLVIPRAHDCLTFFLGSRERYQTLSASVPGAYYYTAGWMECLRRRGDKVPPTHPAFLPNRPGMPAPDNATYHEWVEKYGEDNARHLLEVMSHWTDNYTHGVFIEFDFSRPLGLRQQIQGLCTERGWTFQEVEGDLQLLQRWVDGPWDPRDFLVVPPGHRIQPSYNDGIIEAVPTGSYGGMAKTR